jgi:cytochrome d ubiquinol oxidase subunit I
VGRQPYIVYGLLKTEQAFSPAITSGQVIISLILFGIIYIFLLALFIYLLDNKIRLGPEAELEEVGHRA